MKPIKQIFSQDRIAWLTLIFILILFAIIRYRLLDVPLERDEGEYAYAGQLILKGIFPYLAVYNMKFPGIYAAYAVLLAIFGQTVHGIHLGLVIINSITIFFVFLLARKILNPLGAVMSAACFAILSVCPAVQGFYANAEHFVILFSTAGLFVMLTALEDKSFSKLFIAGILLGIGVLMKQHGIAFCIFAGLFILFDGLRQPIIQWKRLLLNLLSLVGGGAIVFALMSLILFWGGVFKNFWFWTVDYALTYVSRPSITMEKTLHHFLEGAVPIFLSASLLWIMAGCGLLALMTKKIPIRYRVFLLLFFLFSFLSTSPGLYFRWHYFMLLLPCVSLFAGVSIIFIEGYLRKITSKKLFFIIPILLIIICIFQPIWRQRAFFFYMTPFEISRKIYGMNPFPESEKVAEFLKKNTSEKDCIAIFGSEPQIFFYSQRRSASGYIYMYPMMEDQPFALKMQKEFIENVKTRNPKYLLFINVSTSWLRNPDSDLGVLHWLKAQVRNNRIRLVGSVELFPDKSAYHLGKDVKSPTSYYSILIFENTGNLKT